MSGTELSPERRRADRARLADGVVDVLVIGGGVTGAGAALDAASRGLSVGLVEARDWAAGTSSRSSKLIHGGLRYLEQLAFPLVREALKERARLVGTIAPHLVRPLPFLLPLTAPVWQRAYYGAGVALYDVLGAAFARDRTMPRHRHLSRRATLRAFPALRRDVVRGAIRYWDAQVDDARHTLAVVRTAAGYGAAVLSSARVVDLVRDAGVGGGGIAGVGGGGIGGVGGGGIGGVGGGGKAAVVGVRVADLTDGSSFTVRARSVIAATGVWSDDVGEMLGASAPSLKVRASKGIHLVVPRAAIDGGDVGPDGLILRTPTSVLFVIPWREQWIVGTTDTPWRLDRDHPAASSADISYLLDQVNRVLVRPLSADDVVGVYAGLRPLLAGESDDTSRLSREHAVVTPVPGLVLVAGGKYTTYRVMAADAVDAAVAGLPGAPRSRTAELPLVGARGWAAVRGRAAELSAESGVPEDTLVRLLQRHGDQIGAVLDLARDDPALGRPLTGAPGYLAAEVVHAVTAEGALHIDDVLTRRTRVSIETPHRGVDSAPEVAALMARVLGWDEERAAREVTHYTARVAAERESQRMPDDHTADAARLGAPDVRAAV
ncbi:glycerol-3-phosphate dehydrogenase/oxidase [Blastococcus saxobsidens]|uniref:Glycerol-3-phosphate dehydrogenase n=1 Tax=Blastococcus saxobsidens (strain DD2) TaxID=1146883 RepID=H6RKW9_BLASD|nr:glycerol-3-phosphate dehydrogenase/oxidase [Blastococcus saxobsidens]CCG04936.1 Glycerol-3-phosphate dehydrogenase [Blastococcus saxobsidens DD2]